MRYSISSRFQGAVLGAVLGEKISKHSRQISTFQAANCLIPGMRSLIELGRFEQQNWQEKLLPDTKISEFASTIAIPLALFYHENELKLRQNLLAASISIGQNEPIIQESILAVGYAIAQVLSEKLTPAQLIPHILSLIETPQTDLTQKLLQVQTLLTQKAGLERALSQLNLNEPSTTAIALGFYCFLSSQEDFSLTVKRALCLQQPLASTVAGALSGAYNSSSNIPSSWHALVVHQTSTDEKEVLQLSDSLVAVWSGVYEYEVHGAEVITKAVAVAAPGVIRSR